MAQKWKSLLPSSKVELRKPSDSKKGVFGTHGNLSSRRAFRNKNGTFPSRTNYESNATRRRGIQSPGNSIPNKFFPLVQVFSKFSSKVSRFPSPIPSSEPILRGEPSIVHGCLVNKATNPRPLPQSSPSPSFEIRWRSVNFSCLKRAVTSSRASGTWIPADVFPPTLRDPIFQFSCSPTRRGETFRETSPFLPLFFSGTVIFFFSFLSSLELTGNQNTLLHRRRIRLYVVIEPWVRLTFATDGRVKSSKLSFRSSYFDHGGWKNIYIYNGTFRDLDVR